MRIGADIKYFLAEIYRKRYVILELARRDFKSKYMTTYLGFIWTYLQPLLFILILWFVFSFGLRAKPTGDTPFIVYLVIGMVVWLFFADNFLALTNVIQQHAFLVKKGDFSLGILPLAKLLSSLVAHVILIFIAVFVCVFNGVYPSWYTFQIFYYLSALLLLLLGLSWITSSTSIFVKDVINIVQIIVQFGFWLTPVFWNITMVSETYRWIIKLNPVWYIVSGYRDSIIYQIPFWSKPYETLYFWFFTLIVLFFGSIVFRRLKPHFAELM